MVDIVRNLLQKFISDLSVHSVEKEESTQQLTWLRHTIWKGKLYVLFFFEFPQDRSKDIQEGCCEPQDKHTRLVILYKICKTEPMPHSQLSSASIGLTISSTG